MEITWLTYPDSKRRHAFPEDKETYGAWPLCGKGSRADAFEGNQPLCGKCLYIMEKYSDKELESRRFEIKREKNLREGRY